MSRFERVVRFLGVGILTPFYPQDIAISAVQKQAPNERSWGPVAQRKRKIYYIFQ
jgi:hypothetical protein